MDYFIVDDFVDRKICKKFQGYYHNQSIPLEYFCMSEEISNNIVDLIESKFSKTVYIDNWITRPYLPNVQKNGMNMHVDNVDWFNQHLNKWIKVSDRLFTAMLMLNSNYTGGRFKLEDSYIEPKVGRLVLLRANIFHGVEDISSGIRFVKLFWYASSKKYDIFEDACVKNEYFYHKDNFYKNS